MIAATIAARIIILCNRTSSGAASTIQPRHRADRRAGAALDLDRKADKAEAALADELVEIDQPLHVGEAEIAADVMHLEVVAARPPRAHCLDAEHADALVAEPRRRFLGQPGKVGNEARRTVAAAKEIHVQKHGVLRLDGDAGSLLGFL